MPMAVIASALRRLASLHVFPAAANRDALRGVESTGQDQERDEGWNAAARYHPIVDFEHEQRAGEHQNVAHPAEQGDGHEGPPAGTECSRKLCTCGRLPQRAGSWLMPE